MRGLFLAGNAAPFLMFSPVHLVAIGSILLVNILLYIWRDNIADSSRRASYRTGLAVALLLLEVLLQVWYVATGSWSVQHSLPLHLCGISLLLVSLMLFFNSGPVLEIVYYWVLGGSVQAVLTPDISYGFPHVIFFQFFLAHGLLITGCCWMIFVEKTRPGVYSWLKAFGWLNLYALLIAPVNKILQSNYLYLCYPPSHSSLIDLLGPWPRPLPRYIFFLEIVALATFFLLYLPFAVAAYTKDISLSKRGREV